MRKLKKAAVILLSVYILLAILLYGMQEKLIFLPTTLPQDYSYSFSRPHEEIFLKSADGAVLNGLHFKQHHPAGAIVYFHGNAGDLSRWGAIVTLLVDKGFDVIVMDYRTYGKSTGKLSETALFEDGQLFYDYAKNRYSEKDILLYGRSLGTAIATKLASQNKPKQLILESPFYSLEDIARKRFPFLPVKWLLRYKLKSNEYIRQAHCPVAIFHGTDDSVVPYDSGKRLFHSITAKQRVLITVNGAGHNNLAGFEKYLRGLDRVLGLDQSNSGDDK